MNYRNIDSLSLFFSNWISSLFFFQVEFIPPPGRGGAFGQNIYPWSKVMEWLSNRWGLSFMLPSEKDALIKQIKEYI